MKSSPLRLPLACLALAALPLLSYQVIHHPVGVRLRAGSGLELALGADGAPPASLAVGDTCGLELIGGPEVLFSEDDEFTFGDCGYGYPWAACLDGCCSHGQDYGLDVGQCRRENSYGFWESIDGGEAWPGMMSPYLASSMVGSETERHRLLPGPHSIALGSHSALCIHRGDDMERGHCHRVVRSAREATVSLNIVRLASVSGPEGFVTDKVDSSEEGYERGFGETDWLSLPLGEPGTMADFSAAPYPGVPWPDGHPQWELWAGAEVATERPADDLGRFSVGTDTAFSGAVAAHCGTSAILLQLNVVEVAALAVRDSLELDEEGHCVPEEPPWEGQPQDDYAVVEVREPPAQTHVRAYPRPALPTDRLPEAWSLDGPEGDDPLHRALDISTPGTTRYTAVCGASSRSLAVHVSGVRVEGGEATVRETDPQTGHITAVYLLLAMPDLAHDAQDGVDRRARATLRPLNLAALEGLPLNPWHTMGSNGLNHGQLRATCSSGLRFVPDGESEETRQAVHGGEAEPCRALEGLPLDADTPILVEAIGPSPYQRVGHESITLHYESQVISFTHTLAVRVLDLRTGDTRYLLVNDDNDDMLAYPEDATAGRRLTPHSHVRDCDQDSPVAGEDDLRHVSLPFPAMAAGLPPVTMTLAVAGPARLWRDAGRREELTQREWDAEEVAALGDGGLDVWVEGLSPSGSIGDVRLAATWSVANVSLPRTVSLTVLDMRMGVEGGKLAQNINLDDFGSDAPGDFGSARCVFWTNTDHDTLHWDDPFLESGAWHEDDTDAAYGGAPEPNCCDDRIGGRGHATKTVHDHDGTHTVRVPPADADNHCLRDLEDFARLHLRLDPLFAQLEGVEFTLSGAPVNVFEAVEKNLNYLQDLQTAKDQVVKRALPASEGVIRLPAETLRLDGSVSPFIWEGCAPCDADLTLTARLPDGTAIGRRRVRLVLHDIGDFTDFWSSDGVPSEPVARPPGSLALGQTGDDYILFVHGYNVTDGEKADWTATAYKRLWWQGFRGRLGIFSWPCVTLPSWDLISSLPTNTYDNSDFIAHESGKQLSELLAKLERGYCHGKVHILAHSQGNVVTGEGLRQLKECSVRTYIASQAAISISNYIHVETPYFEKPGYGKPGTSHSTPDVRAKFPGCHVPAPYLTPVIGGRVAKCCNLFNAEDYALRSCDTFSWEDDNQMRPNISYSYHSTNDTDIRDYNEDAPLCSHFMRFQKLYFPDKPKESQTDTFQWSDMRDTYEILSYAAEAWGEPLGIMASVDGFTEAMDLQSSPLNYDKEHYSHSRQFRSNIVAEHMYWHEVMRICSP